MALLQETGGVLTYRTVSDLNTVLPPTATAPTGTGGIVLATSPALVTPNLGTPSAINLANATGLPQGALPPSLIQTITVPLTLVNIQSNNTIPVPILAAQGAGTLIQVLDWTFDLIRGSAAYSGGGAVGLYLGTTSAGVLVSTAVAATFFTTFTASHIIYNPGSIMAVAASTTILNTGLVMSNPTADFTSGTGGTGILSITYRVISGLS